MLLVQIISFFMLFILSFYISAWSTMLTMCFEIWYGNSKMKTVERKLLNEDCWVKTVEWRPLNEDGWMETVEWRRLNGDCLMKTVGWRLFNGGCWMETVEWRRLNEDCWTKIVEWRLLNENCWMKAVEWRLLDEDYLMEAVSDCVLKVLRWRLCVEIKERCSWNELGLRIRILVFMIMKMRDDRIMITVWLRDKVIWSVAEYDDSFFFTV